MRTFTDWTDFTIGHWCSQVQILLVEKDFESRCRRLTACFSMPGMTVNNAKPHQRLTVRVFTFISSLLKPAQSSLYLLLVRNCKISKRFHGAALKYKLKYVRKNVKQKCKT
jgi:hypothetical protein